MRSVNRDSSRQLPGKSTSCSSSAAELAAACSRSFAAAAAAAIASTCRWHASAASGCPSSVRQSPSADHEAEAEGSASTTASKTSPRPHAAPRPSAPCPRRAAPRESPVRRMATAERHLERPLQEPKALVGLIEL